MSSLDRLLDTMDGLMEDFNNSTATTAMKLKAENNLLRIDLDLERQVSRNHEKMLHLYDVRVHELDDKVDALETELEVRLHEIHELQEKLEQEKRQRLMDQWMCDTWEEYMSLGQHLEDLEVERERETKRLRSRYEE